MRLCKFRIFVAHPSSTDARIPTPVHISYCVSLFLSTQQTRVYIPLSRDAILPAFTRARLRFTIGRWWWDASLLWSSEYPLEEPNATSNYYVERDAVVVALQRVVDGMGKIITRQNVLHRGGWNEKFQTQYFSVLRHITTVFYFERLHKYSIINVSGIWYTKVEVTLLHTSRVYIYILHTGNVD